MNAKTLRLAKNISWTPAAVAMLFLVLGNEKNNLLNAVTFVLIILGMIFSALQDKKS